MKIILWKCQVFMYLSILMQDILRGRRGHDRMVVGFTTTYAISTYHYWYCELESRSGRGVQHYVMKFVSDLRQVGGFLRGTPVSFTNKTDHHAITEILLKVGLHTINQPTKYFLTFILTKNINSENSRIILFFYYRQKIVMQCSMLW